MNVEHFHLCGMGVCEPENHVVCIYQDNVNIMSEIPNEIEKSKNSF